MAAITPLRRQETYGKTAVHKRLRAPVDGTRGGERGAQQMARAKVCCSSPTTPESLRRMCRAAAFGPKVFPGGFAAPHPLVHPYYSHVSRAYTHVRRTIIRVPSYSPGIRAPSPSPPRVSGRRNVVGENGSRSAENSSRFKLPPATTPAAALPRVGVVTRDGSSRRHRFDSVVIRRKKPRCSIHVRKITTVVRTRARAIRLFDSERS